MNILLVHHGVIPVSGYGGIERVVWWLGKEFIKLGHKVSFLVKRGSHCDFAPFNIIDETKPYAAQIPEGTDIAHFSFDPREELPVPKLVMIQGNMSYGESLDINTVFVSRDHAVRHGSTQFVHNGVDWSDYGSPSLDRPRKYFHFLGKAAWRVKNVKGAIDVITRTPSERLAVLGGNRLNLSMGFRFTLSPRVSFHGMVGGEMKNELLRSSKGLVFPVRWHEPFGLALVESLYFGCPVFGTPYGSLPEIVIPGTGMLSAESRELTAAVQNSAGFDRRKCHEYAVEMFNSRKMALAYLQKYEVVMNGGRLNQSSPSLLKKQDARFLEWR